MQRINSFRDVASTGRVQIDTGDGIQIEVPVSPDGGDGGGFDSVAALAAFEAGLST